MKLPVAFSAVNGDVYCEIVKPPVGKDSPAKYARPGVPLAFLTSVYTSPALRKNGLAGMLLAVALAWAKATSTDLCTYARDSRRGGSKGPDSWDLMFWYLRLGFEIAEGATNDPQCWLIWRHDQPPKSESLKDKSRKTRVRAPKKS